MFIPTWLIVCGVIMVIVYFNQKEKASIGGDSEGDSSPGLSRIASRWKHEEDMGKFDPENAKGLLQKHQSEIAPLMEDATSLKNARTKFDEKLRFSERLWQFIQDVKYYPSWYGNSKNDDGTPYWRSSAIKPEELLLRKFSDSQLKSLIEKQDKFKDDDEILEYGFASEERGYTLFVNRELRHRDSYGADDWSMYYYPTFIFDNEKKLVYQSQLIYKTNGDLDYYDHSFLDAFKPGGWTVFLANKVCLVRQEEEKHTEEFWKKLNNERAEKEKKNFAD